MKSIDKSWELLIVSIFDSILPCQGFNVPKLEIFEDILRYCFIERNCGNLFSGHEKHICCWRLFHSNNVLANCFLIVVQHEMTNFKEPGIDCINVGLDWWSLRFYYFIFSLFSGSFGKGKFQGTYDFDIGHNSLLNYYFL